MGNTESLSDGSSHHNFRQEYPQSSGAHDNFRHQYPQSAINDDGFRHQYPQSAINYDDFRHQYPHPAGSRDDFQQQYRQPAGVHDDFRHQYPQPAGVPDGFRHQYLQPAGGPDDFRHQYPRPAGSAIDTDYRRNKHPTFIADNFNSLEEVTSALREAGLESSNLILGIDFTKSNEWTGKYSFKRRSLHSIGDTPNPYEQAISIISRTLSPFDEDNKIPCFGFGDASTHDQYVFAFYPDHRPCHGFEEALARYREIIPYLKLSGPTSFAPIIDAAIDIVEKSSGQYHVLVVIADGQVTNNPDTPPGTFSVQEQATINSIVAASGYPLSIILVGVGDGPWDAMQKFDDNIPQRAFDNFQFVNFTKIMSEHTNMAKKEAAFALAALMEIPFQFRAAQSLQYRKNTEVQWTKPLPPPPEVIDHDNAVRSVPHMTSFGQAEPTAPGEQVCPICLTNAKDMAFGCGHLTCKECGTTLSLCPLCREPISARIRLYT